MKKVLSKILGYFNQGVYALRLGWTFANFLLMSGLVLLHHFVCDLTFLAVCLSAVISFPFNAVVLLFPSLFLDCEGERSLVNYAINVDKNLVARFFAFYTALVLAIWSVQQTAFVSLFREEGGGVQGMFALLCSWFLIPVLMLFESPPRLHYRLFKSRSAKSILDVSRFFVGDELYAQYIKPSDKGQNNLHHGIFRGFGFFI